jgi:tetratricopeptide (TPR) repeat protein
MVPCEDALLRIIRQILEGTAPGRSFTLNWKMDKHITEQPWAALMYDSVEQYESVIRALTDHLGQNPGNGAAYNNRAVAYWEIGELDKALEDFHRAVANSAHDHRPAKHRGMLLKKLGRLDEALASLDHAVRIAPDDPYLRRTRGHVRFQSGRYHEAIEDFSRAIELQPEFKQTYLDRARAFEMIGNRSGAGEDHARAREV